LPEQNNINPNKALLVMDVQGTTVNRLKDYEKTVLSDCCADMDEEVHRVLTTKIFPRQAEVITSEEWNIGMLGGR
jgi:hypothetical protein